MTATEVQVIGVAAVVAVLAMLCTGSWFVGLLAATAVLALSQARSR